MTHDARRMTVSSTWVQAAVLSFLVGFTVLGIVAYLVSQQHPPIPDRVVDPAGANLVTVFTTFTMAV